MGRLTGIKKQNFKIIPINLRLKLAEDLEAFVGHIGEELEYGKANNNAVLREMIRIAITNESIKSQIIRAIDDKAIN